VAFRFVKGNVCYFVADRCAEASAQITRTPFVSPFFHETALQMKSQSASRATNQGLMPADTSAQ
jgi:hypothetical protein